MTASRRAWSGIERLRPTVETMFDTEPDGRVDGQRVEPVRVAQRTSLDSSLVRSSRRTGRARKQMENSWRTSPSVNSMTWAGSL